MLSLPMTSSITVESIEASARHATVDLTPMLEAQIAGAGIVSGFVVVFSRHTTCALMINELEDGAGQDLSETLDRLFPPSAYYAHDDLSRRTQNLQENERANGHAHIAMMLMGGTSQTIPVADGAPLLGRWQRLLMVELDEPKPREIVFQVVAA